MAYVEMHQELGDHPKTRRFMRLLKVSRHEAIGLLTDLWWWAMDYAQDGDLSRYDACDIADGAHFDGDPDALVEALVGCGIGTGHGFVERDEKGGLRLHDWHLYGGKLAAEKKRQAYLKWLSRHSAPDTPANYAQWETGGKPVSEPSTPDVPPTSGNSSAPVADPSFFVGGMSDGHTTDAYRSREQSRAEERSGDQQQQREAEPSRHEPTGAEPDTPDLPVAAFATLSSAATDALLPDCADLTARLVAEGVNAPDASRLAHAKPLVCLRQLEFLPFVKEFKTSRGAWLRSAIESDYAPPKAYLDAQKRKTDDERRAREKAERAERQAHIEQEKALLDAEVQRLKDLPDEWQKIVQEASAKVPVDMPPNLRQGNIDGKVRRIVFERMQAQSSQSMTGAVRH